MCFIAPHSFQTLRTYAEHHNNTPVEIWYFLSVPKGISVKMLGKYMSPSSSTKVNTGLKLWSAVSLLLVIEYILIYHISPESQGYAVFDAISCGSSRHCGEEPCRKVSALPQKGNKAKLCKCSCKMGFIVLCTVQLARMSQQLGHQAIVGASGMHASW